MDYSKVVLWKSFLTLHFFGLKNAKIKFLKKIRGLSAVFFRIKVQVISNPSSRLEKTPNPSIFAYERFFVIFFKKKLISQKSLQLQL